MLSFRLRIMNRRAFINNVAVGGTGLAVSPSLFNATGKSQSPLKLALIGKGGMGTADTNTAIRVPGVELVSVCDIYAPRLEAAKEQWGQHLRVEKDYRQVLDDNQIDAVIIATPDHWHQKIAVEALKKGKHVYCEKPIIHQRSEARALIKAQKESGKIFQMGTQGVSAVGTHLAKVLVESKIIGEINFVDARFSAAPSPLKGFRAPSEATAENIWWDRFLGPAPKVPFTPQRFFAWRNWGDYGTGLAGDLFVHVIASVHFITGSSKPKRVYSDGDILYYNDGSRDTPDVIYSLLDYENETKKTHFKMSLGANIVDGVSKEWGSRDFKIIGSKGSIRVNWDSVTVKTVRETDVSGVERLLKQVAGFDKTQKISDTEYTFLAKSDFRNAHFLHFQNFFEAVRGGLQNIAPVEFGIDASSAALLSFESQVKRQVV